jgi:hypothetical protein
MCTRHHTHCSVEYVSVQDIDDRGHRSRWSDTCCSETPTVQYIIYYTKRTVRNLVSSCENDSAVRVLEFPLALPRLPKKLSTTYPKRLPIQFLITSVTTQEYLLLFGLKNLALGGSGWDSLIS